MGSPTPSVMIVQILESFRAVSLIWLLRLSCLKEWVKIYISYFAEAEQYLLYFCFNILY